MMIGYDDIYDVAKHKQWSTEQLNKLPVQAAVSAARNMWKDDPFLQFEAYKMLCREFVGMNAQTEFRDAPKGIPGVIVDFFGRREDVTFRQYGMSFNGRVIRIVAGYSILHNALFCRVLQPLPPEAPDTEGR